MRSIDEIVNELREINRRGDAVYEDALKYIPKQSTTADWKWSLFPPDMQATIEEVWEDWTRVGQEYTLTTGQPPIRPKWDYAFGQLTEGAPGPRQQQ